MKETTQLASVAARAEPLRLDLSNLDAALRTRIVEYLILTGCTTNVCVESTLHDAMFRGHSSLLLSDCTAEHFGSHDSSLLVIDRSFGWVATSSGPSQKH
jgi:ureidoacrylate peracid hydrolase